MIARYVLKCYRSAWQHPLIACILCIVLTISLDGVCFGWLFGCFVLLCRSNRSLSVVRVLPRTMVVDDR